MAGTSLGIFASLGIYVAFAGADRNKDLIGLVVGMVSGWLCTRQIFRHLANQSQNVP